MKKIMNYYFSQSTLFQVSFTLFTGMFFLVLPITHFIYNSFNFLRLGIMLLGAIIFFTIDIIFSNYKRNL